MTKSQAIYWLRNYYNTNFQYNARPGRALNNEILPFEENIYLKFLIDKLIHHIYATWEDPLTVVANMHYYMDKIVEESEEDHLVTHRFASYMSALAHDIYWFLKRKEKELDDMGRC